jgi:hypothetical protein
LSLHHRRGKQSRHGEKKSDLLLHICLRAGYYSG